MEEQRWNYDLIARFSARGNPELHRTSSPALARLADELLADPTGFDIDLSDLIRFAVTFADETTQALDQNPRALRAGGAAFLHAGHYPTAIDLGLIAKGNSQYRGDPQSKLARDTWSYLVYKRALGDLGHPFYSYKPGASMRRQFQDAVIAAVALAADTPDAFRILTHQQRARESTAAAIEYVDKQPGIASSAQRHDRSDARDLNFPDGTLVPLGARFTKTWEVRNIGQVPWIGRRLTRMTPQGPTFPWSGEWIPIPDTFPGQSVQLSVDFIAARVQGFTTVRFKMTDDQGALYFPNKYAHGLTLLIETGGVEWIDRKLP